MFPVSEENYREVHGEEEVNIPTYMEQKTRFIYMAYFCLFLSINISPVVDPEILKGE